MLEAIDQGSRDTVWSFTGRDVVTAPIVVDDVVLVGTSSGTVFALDAANGAELWSDAAGTQIEPPDEHNTRFPLVGLGLGDGYLLVPAGDELVGYKLIP